MDEQNQISGQQMGPMPSMPPAASPKSQGMLLWIIIAIVVLAGSVAWWYLSRMMSSVEPVVQQQPQINQEAREDMLIDDDIQSANLGDLDMEFKSIDNDLNGF